MGGRRSFSLILLFFSVSLYLSVAQTKRAENPAPRITVIPTTLLMDWTRGDPRYGPDVIALRAPCQSGDAPGCICKADFKATRSKEFADYVTSFPHEKVPVVYEVWRNPEGRFLGANFVRVGDWSGHTGRNDGLLGVSYTFKLNHPERARIQSPGDCFPRLP